MSPRRHDADDLFDDESDDEELDALDGGELDDLEAAEFDRLHHEAVHAERIAAHPVALLGRGGQDHDRNRPRPLVCLDLPVTASSIFVGVGRSYSSRYGRLGAARKRLIFRISE